MTLIETMIVLLISALAAIYQGKKSTDEALTISAQLSANNMAQAVDAVNDYIKMKGAGFFPVNSVVTIDVSPASVDANYRTPSTGNATDGIVTSKLWPGRNTAQTAPPYTVSTFSASPAKSWSGATQGYWVQFETDATGKFTRGLMMTKTGWCANVGVSCTTASTDYYQVGIRATGNTLMGQGRQVAYPTCGGAMCANGSLSPTEFTQASGGAVFVKAKYTKLANTGQMAVILSGSNGYDSTYLRLDGTNSMTANLNLGNNGITNGTVAAFSGAVNVGSVAATGAISTTGTVQAGSGANVVTLNSGNTGGVSASGNVAGATVQGTSKVYAGATLAGATTVVLDGATGVATAPNDVAITNMQAQTRVSGNSNSGPSITSVKSLLPNFVDTQSVVVVNDGSTITKPICQGAGQPQIFVIAQRLRGTVQMGTWGADTRAIDSGATWTIYAKDAQGQSLAPNDFALVAKISCSY